MKHLEKIRQENPVMYRMLTWGWGWGSEVRLALFEACKAKYDNPGLARVPTEGVRTPTVGSGPAQRRDFDLPINMELTTNLPDEDGEEPHEAIVLSRL